jgi:hypothetical protein
MTVNSGADVLGDLALEQLRDRRGKLDDFHAALDLALCVREKLSVFGGNHSRELVGLPLQNAEEPVQDPAALQRRDLCPGGEGPSLCE